MQIAKRILAGCAAIATLVAPSANAATSTWTNTAGGSYDTAGNWSAAPASTDDVVFNLNNTYTVLFPTGADTTNRTALIDGGNVTFDLGGAGRNYTLAGIPSSFEGLVVGTNNATLTLTNGTLTTPSTTIGYYGGGTLNVSTGATLNGSALRINLGSTGSLSITGGGEVAMGSATLGFAPNAGDTFDILSALVLHGTFDSTVFPVLGNNLRWELQYLLDAVGMDTVRLSAQVVPVPAAVWFFGSGLAALALLRRRSAPARATLH